MFTFRHVHKQLVEKVWYLKLFDNAICVELALKFASSVMAPGEQATLRKLYVIERGMVLYRGAVMSQGKVWGADDVILTDGLLKFERLDRAQAMTYAETRELSRDDLLAVITKDPRAMRQMRKYAVYVATKRHMIAVAKEVMAKAEEEAIENGEPSKRGSSSRGGLLSKMDNAVLDSTKKMKYIPSGSIGSALPEGSAPSDQGYGGGQVSQQLTDVTRKLNTLTEAVYAIANGHVQLTAAVDGMHSKLDAHLSHRVRKKSSRTPGGGEPSPGQQESPIERVRRRHKASDEHRHRSDDEDDGPGSPMRI